MLGFLLQWPTFATLLMFPILLVVYRRLAIREEREVRAEMNRRFPWLVAEEPVVGPGGT